MSENYRAAFPALLKEKLDKHGISQKELAELLDIHPSAVSRWLSTSRGNIVLPSLESIKNIEWAVERIIAKRVKNRAVAQ